MRKTILALVLALGVSLCPLAAPAHSADQSKILDTTVGKYRDAAKSWEPVLKNYAKKLFLVLCVISLVFTAGWGFLRGNMGIGDFFAEFVKFGITMGFFYWLLENGPEMAKAIIDSMTLMGQQAASTYVVKLTPSDICTQGFGLLYDAIAEFGKSDVSTGIMVIIVALAISVVFGIIAAQMVVLLCSSWILIYGGVFYLGFGGGQWTSDIAKNYFKVILAQAMQVFTFCLLIGIGQTEINSLTVGLRTTKNIAVANYWWAFGLGGEPTKVVQSQTLTLSAMCVCLVFAIILLILVSRVPGLVAGVITGASISAMAFGGVGGAMNSAAGIVTGGAMIASQAAGAGLALASAYKASSSSMASGGGDQGAAQDASAGDSAASAASGGLAAAMSGGLSFAYNMVSNLASGAAGAVKDDLQKSTVGGKMSAMIEANSQMQGGNDGAKDGGGGSENGGDAGQGAAGESAGVQAGGISTDTASQGGDGGGADSSANSDSPNFDFGAISSGSGDSAFDREWNEAIASYDPKKVGLLDES